MPSSETRMLMSRSCSTQNFDDPREHRNRAVRCQSGRVDPDLAHPRQMPVEHLDHLRQVVARRRLAAGDIQVLDGAPERMGQGRLELRERHVRLAIPVLPVVAHLARASQTQVQL